MHYPTPQVILNLGAIEPYGISRQSWENAYAEIAKKHPELQKKADDLTQRINLAYKLTVNDEQIDNSLRGCDETLYGQRAQEVGGYSTKDERLLLLGDFPCGNDNDMVFARYLFSIREMAYIQMGLAGELNPDDISEVPRDKSFALGTIDEKRYDDASLVMGRRGFIHECLGHWEEAIDCYLAIKPARDIPKYRINNLEPHLPFGMLKTEEEGSECDITIYSSGYIHHDQVLGIALEKHKYSFYRRSPDDPGTVSWRMYCSKTEVTGELVGVRWNGTEKEPYVYEGEVQRVSREEVISNMSIKKDKQGRPTYCGNYDDGLGVMFFYANGNNNRFVAIPGLWKDHKLTHLMHEGRLIPLFETMSKDDAVVVVKALNAIVNMDASQRACYEPIISGASAMKNLTQTEFTPEMIDSFCYDESSWVQEYSDFDVRENEAKAGFKIDGQIRGFMWKRTWDNGPGSEDYHYCGIRDESKPYFDYISGIRYNPKQPQNGFKETDYVMTDLVERDKKGRIVFCGMHKEGVRHGLGSEFFYLPSGEIIEVQGLWQNGKLTHKRRKNELVLFDDDYYEGDVNEEGLAHGWGSKDFAGDHYYACYEGNWRNGLINGRGRLIMVYDDDGSMRTEECFGEWVDGQLHGDGTYILGWEDPGSENVEYERYEGAFREGKRCGHGVSTYSNGDRFEGEFANDLPNGPGIYTFSDGDRLEGEWKDGEYVTD